MSEDAFGSELMSERRKAKGKLHERRRDSAFWTRYVHPLKKDRGSAALTDG